MAKKRKKASKARKAPKARKASGKTRESAPLMKKSSTRRAVSQEHHIIKKAMEQAEHTEAQPVPEYKQLEQQNKTFLEEAISLKKMILRK